MPRWMDIVLRHSVKHRSICTLLGLAPSDLLKWQLEEDCRVVLKEKEGPFCMVVRVPQLVPLALDAGGMEMTWHPVDCKPPWDGNIRCLSTYYVSGLCWTLRALSHAVPARRLESRNY